MANGNSKVLTAEQEMQIRRPIEEYVGAIQKQIDGLRVDGTDKVLSLQNTMDGVKRDRTLTKGEKEDRLTRMRRELQQAKAVESKNKDRISKLIADAEAYLKEHFDKEYYVPVKESCAQEKVLAKEKYQKRVEELKKEHQQILSKLSEHQEIKDEKYVYKNRLFDAKMELQKDYQTIKDRRHAAYSYKYHLIDEKYELKILNECVCIVDYQMDGSSTNMYRQYVRNPKGFAFWRKEQMKHSINTKQKIKACIHYVSSSLIAKNKHFIKESPEKFLTVLSVPLGFLLKIIVVKKSKSSYMKVEGI